MYQEDYYPEGFQWINCTYHEESLAMFVRKTKKPEETLLFICNFDNIEHETFRVGVPFYGKYKEIFSSEEERFGGAGSANTRVKTAKAIEWDGRDYSIEIHIPAMSVSIFSCTPLEEKKTALKKTAGKAAEGKTIKKTAVKAKVVKKAVKTEPVAKTKAAEKADKVEKTDKANRAEKVEKTNKAEKTDKAEKSNKAEKTEKKKSAPAKKTVKKALADLQ